MIFSILIFAKPAECKMTHAMIHSVIENPGLHGFLEIYENDQVFLCCVYGYIQIYSVQISMVFNYFLLTFY